MSATQNKAFIRRYYDLYNQGDLEALAEVFAPDVVCNAGGGTEPVRGLEANLQMETHTRSVFSGIRMTVLDMIAEGDTVAVRRAWSMVHTGEFEGMPPTGKELTGTAAEFFHIVDGKIAEMWTESDNLSFMQQLGAIPEHAGMESTGL